MTAIKIYYRAAELARLIAALGWEVRVDQAGDGFLVGEARLRG